MSETFEQMALRVACEEGITSRSGDEETERQRIVAFATRIRDELCKGQEPATAVVGKVGDSGGSNMLTNLLPMGTKLYLHPALPEALRRERDTFYMDYRMKCDAETKALYGQLAAMTQELAEWKTACEQKTEIMQSHSDERQELQRQVLALTQERDAYQHTCHNIADELEGKK